MRVTGKAIRMAEVDDGGTGGLVTVTGHPVRHQRTCEHVIWFPVVWFPVVFDGSVKGGT